MELKGDIKGAEERTNRANPIHGIESQGASGVACHRPRELESNTWNWKSFTNLSASTLPPARIQYMELKGYAGGAGGSATVTSYWIQYMELKEDKATLVVEILINTLKNPIHGIESRSAWSINFSRSSHLLWIQYMELKEDNKEVSGVKPLWFHVNPIHGIERCSTRLAPYTFLFLCPESNTWNWKM